MSLLNNIAVHILDVHMGDNWTEVNIQKTLEDVSFEEAVRVTPISPNSMAMLLHHLTFYNEVVLQRLLDLYIPIPQSNGFDLTPVTSEEQWQRLQHKNLQSAHALAEGILQFPINRLFELTANGKTTFYKNLHGVAEHAHYHLGQITMLKKLIRSGII